MRLYIAEKPSMGAEIAKCLNNGTLPPKKNGCIPIGEDVVTWAYGHILEQFAPNDYDPKYKIWRLEDLPILPQKWQVRVTKNCESQFNVICDLVRRADEIIHAGDPDREGQLLIDEILEFVKNEKPVQRLLLNALDEKSIRLALSDLRPNQSFESLRDSAYARSCADWLVGMNLTRAYTLAARRAGFQDVIPVGRVKTPTMALVVRREREIQKFKPTTHYQLKVRYKGQSGEFYATYQPEDTSPNLDSEGRILKKEVLEQLSSTLSTARAAVMSYSSEKKQTPPRLPYSLSSLQMDAGKLYGYDPQTVLDTAQTLYERKFTTYPRSDCDYLPENQFSDAPEIAAALDGNCKEWLEKTDLTMRSRAFNDKKITAHHAIIPTRTVCDIEKLTETERNIYLLIAKAYIAQFYPAHTYLEAKATIAANDCLFTAAGKTVLDDGWKTLYQNEPSEEKEESLPALCEGEDLRYVSHKIHEITTKPPKRYTTATLLGAMKNIHQYVQPEYKKKLKESHGIGTEATRAGIIKDLIDRKLLAVEKKNLIPTEQAYMLVDLLPTAITAADTTAIWEDALTRIGSDYTLQRFIAEQSAFVEKYCAAAQTLKIPPRKNAPLCPLCGSVLTRRKNGDRVFWGCSAYPKCRMLFSEADGKPYVQKCPVCNEGYLLKQQGKKGAFWGCSCWRDGVCKATFTDEQGKPGQLTKQKK